VRVTLDAQGNPELHYPGDCNIAVRGHRDIVYRAEVLAQAGIDRQVLTFTTPGTHIEEPARAAQFARLINDSFARIVSERTTRFSALATLPLNDPSASVAEFDRAVTQLGMGGAMLFSNVDGVALADERYWPLYERAAEHKAVLYIHPTHPVGVEAMTEYWLMPLIGFPMDTTLAAAKLVLSGVVRRFPDIRWILAHLGGAIPYLAERLDRGYEAFAECRRHLDQPPSYYLRRIYYDSVNFDPAALRLAIGFAGVDHILAGSDYPHQIGSLEKMRQTIQALGLSAEDEAKVLVGNTQRLLGLAR
jgi:aminocarboxymuconate-semialdehyde decarboxylase